MDTVDAFVQSEGGRRIEKFLISGASKRGWTTWLTAAVDVRVKAIAPMVIDSRHAEANRVGRDDVRKAERAN